MCLLEFELRTFGRAVGALNRTTNQRVQMDGPMASAAYVAEDGLLGLQWEERPLVLIRLDASW